METKKHLIAIAVANALGMSSSAYAEIEIYGTVAAAVEALDNDTDSTTEVSNNHSAFGIKGSADVGNGMKGVFLFDAFLGIDDGASGDNTADSTLFGGGRDGYVGLNGDGFGTVALGYHGRPWKTSTNHVDIFGSTIADYSALMGTTPGMDGAYFDGGIVNSIIWFLPKVNNLSGHVQYGTDEADDDTNDYGAQVNYTMQNIYLSFSYDVDGRGAGVDDISAIKLAGTYKMGNTTFAAIFDSISDSPVNSRDAIWIAASHMLGDNTFKVAFATADDSDAGGADDGATYIALGVDHKLGDNLTGYVIYSLINNDDGGTYRFITAPHTSSNNNTTVGAGDDSSVIALGIKLDFNYKTQ